MIVSQKYFSDDIRSVLKLKMLKKRNFLKCVRKCCKSCTKVIIQYFDWKKTLKGILSKKKFQLLTNVQCTAVQCNEIKRNATQRNATQRNATQRNAMQRNATQRNAIQRNATQYHAKTLFNDGKSHKVFVKPGTFGSTTSWGT